MASLLDDSSDEAAGRFNALQVFVRVRAV